MAKKIKPVKLGSITIPTTDNPPKKEGVVEKEVKEVEVATTPITEPEPPKEEVVGEVNPTVAPAAPQSPQKPTKTRKPSSAERAIENLIQMINTNDILLREKILTVVYSAFHPSERSRRIEWLNEIVTFVKSCWNTLAGLIKENEPVTYKRYKFTFEIIEGAGYITIDKKVKNDEGKDEFAYVCTLMQDGFHGEGLEKTVDGTRYIPKESSIISWLYGINSMLEKFAPENKSIAQILLAFENRLHKLIDYTPTKNTTKNKTKNGKELV
jgi:hypothetical protein